MFIIQNCGKYRRRIALPKEIYKQEKEHNLLILFLS